MFREIRFAPFPKQRIGKSALLYSRNNGLGFGKSALLHSRNNGLGFGKSASLHSRNNGLGFGKSASLHSRNNGLGNPLRSIPETTVVSGMRYDFPKLLDFGKSASLHSRNNVTYIYFMLCQKKPETKILP